MPTTDSTSSSPLWKKAPVVLLRFPALFAAVAFGALLLSLVAAAYPLFLSSATSELLNEQITAPLVTRYGAGMSYRVTNARLADRAPGDGLLSERREALFRQRAAESPLLDPVISGVRGPVVSLGQAEDPGSSRPVALFAGTGALDHVDRIVGRDGSGVWVADAVASPLRLEPGDRIVLESQAGGTVEIIVDGVYRSLYRQPRSGYWLPWNRWIYPPPCRFCPPGPTFVLVDRDQLFELARRLREPVGAFAWTAPLDADVEPSLDDARALAGLADRFEDEMSDPSSIVGQVFECCGPLFDAEFGRGETSFVSVMPDIVSEVNRRISAIEAPGRLLEVAGIVVALIVIGMAGAFALAARRTEVDLLFTRGMSPLAAAAKAGLESLVPCLLGTLLGLALAFGLVRALGPDGSIAASAIGAGARAAAIGAVASVILVGVVVWAGFPRRLEHRPARARVLAQFPWDLLLLAVAFLLQRRLRTEGTLSAAELDLRRPSSSVVLFPLSLIAGSALLAARALVWAARAARRWSRGLRPAPYLAVHRVAGRPGATVLVVSSAALCLGTFAYAQTIVGSLQTTVDAKARLFVGSDVQARVDFETPVPEGFPLPITRVTKVPAAGRLVPGGAPFDLLAVDPATLASAAYWDVSLSDQALSDLVRALDDEGGGEMPVVVAGSATTPESLAMRGRTVPVTIVGRASAFPGVVAGHPLVVASATNVDRVFAGTLDPLREPNASTQWWIRGAAPEALRAISGLEFPPDLVLSAEEVADIPYVAAVVSSFVVLRVLAVVAAVLIVVVMLMYLQARLRADTVSAALSTRMGLSEASHRRAVVAEVGTMLGFSFALGLTLALWAAFLVLPRLDPLSSTPPAPFFVLPLLPAALALLALVFVSWLGGRIAMRVARTTRIGEVLRLAD